MIDVRTSRVTTRLSTAAPSRMICMKSWYWRRKACQPDSFFLAARIVGAVLLQPLLRLGRAQPLGRIDLQLFRDRLRRSS